MPPTPNPGIPRGARRVLAERTARVRRIRRRVMASGLSIFALSFALITASGSFGTTRSATASPAGQASAVVTAAVTDAGASPDSGSDATAGEQDSVSPVTTSQS